MPYLQDKGRCSVAHASQLLCKQTSAHHAAASRYGKRESLTAVAYNEVDKGMLHVPGHVNMHRAPRKEGICQGSADGLQGHLYIIRSIFSQP